MKVKQQTLKGFEFEIDSDQAFKEYYTKNEPLLNGYLLILRGQVSAEIENYLSEKNAAFINGNVKDITTRKKRNTVVPEERPSKDLIEKEALDIPSVPKNASVYHRPIRSGEEIESDSDLLFFSRINSGAVIESSRSIQVFGIIDGLVRSEGEYIILKEIGKGNVFFHGEEVDKSQLDGQLKLIQYKDGIVMKDILG